LSRLPPFATGKLIDDYAPLFLYWQRAREEGREDLVEKSMLSEDDFKFVETLVKSSPSMTLLELMDALITRFRERVDLDVASRALGQPKEVAAERLLRALAGWLIEASETFMVLGLRSTYSLPKD
jgi:hypothetical protein